MERRVKWAILDDTLLREIVRRIVGALAPEKIIMFGSYAKGTASDESDLDLMVILSKSDLPRPRSGPAYEALQDIFLPMDILVYTGDEVEDWRNVPMHITATATREGRVIYETAH